MHFNGYSASVLSSIAMETCNHQSSSLQPRKSKANHANSVRNIHYFIQYFERHCFTAFRHKGVINCGFRKLVRYNLNGKSLYYDMVQML